MNEKAGVVRYVGIMKKLFIAFSIVTIPLFFVSLMFAIMRYAAFWIITPVLGIAYFVVYGLYAMRISMGTVLGVQLLNDSVRIVTKRKIFLYDAQDGCVSVKQKKNKFIAVFRTADSQDSFIFYRRVLFSPYHEEQFTAEEMKLIYPAFNEERNGANA